MNFVSVPHLCLCFALTAAVGGASLLGENIALHRAAYQSNSADDDHTAHLATDGSAETYWESAPGKAAWIAIDLGESCAFDRVTIQWGKVFATQFRIETSDDGLHPSHWRALGATFQGQSNLQTLALPGSRARHLRLIASAVSDPARGCVIEEISVNGSRSKLPQVASGPQRLPDGSLMLSAGDWKLQNALLVKAAPADLSRVGFDDASWIPAAVPGTVLGSYFALGAVPDPWYGDQMSQLSEDFFTKHDFWYRERFTGPTLSGSQRAWLNFDGINWKAEVYLNGRPVGRIDGAFLRGRFEVTALLRPGQENVVAVLLHHVVSYAPGPKKVLHRKLGAETSNGDLLGYDSPTFLASAGWNWLPIVRGREIGIWNQVRLDVTGQVEMLDPWVTSDFPAGGIAQADLAVRTELHNAASSPQHGRLVGSIGAIHFEQAVTVAPGATLAVKIDPTGCPALRIASPRLWWPNGYGEQPLYTLKLRFEQDGRSSDEKSVNFGIRKLEYRVFNNVLTFYVNDVRILVRGGNWGMAEGMLNIDAAGYDLRVRLHHDAHLNMIRNWIGMEGRDAFYDACDRYGILIWDDFWLANPNDGPDPTDHAMFMINAKDKIRHFRSHASLALWCGRNEGYPPPDLDAALRLACDELDGTRYYIPHSADGQATGFGPYRQMDVDWYFANRGKTLHSELGIVAFPTVQTMRAMMPEKDLWPISDMWSVHDYQTMEKGLIGRGPLYTKRIGDRYGAPTGIEDFCRKAQMVNMELSKAMFESLQSNQGSGTLLWMTQSAWPSTTCQLYDHFFDMTSAYFGARSGSEPVHVLWDSSLDVIKAANNTQQGWKGLTVESKTYDLNGKQIGSQSARLDLAPTSAQTCFAFHRPTDPHQVFFVRLALKHGEDVLSTNFYWNTANGATCTALNQLPPVELKSSTRAVRSDSQVRITAELSNPTSAVALMVHLRVQRRKSGERVLPVFYDDNYFTLLPGEKRAVGLDFAATDLAGDEPQVMADGWNIPVQEIGSR